MVLNLAGNVILLVADPEMIQDLLVTKNSLFDKTGMQMAMFHTLFGSSFIFAKADDLWKRKRKASAHAFYKERLIHMLEILKDKVEEDCELWSA